jgi:hypothetical protein
MQTVDEKVLRIFAHHATIREWLLQHGLLSTYGDSLFGWVVSQLEWISARTPRALRRDLFRTVQPIVAGYDVATVERALRDGEKGDVTWMIVGALVSNSLADFNRVLDTRGAPSSVAVKTAYHLRYGGIRETARIGRRYAAQRGLPVGSPPDDQPSLSDIGLETDGAVRNKDLLFALVLLEKRLEALEQRLASGDDAGQPGRTDSADGPPTDSSVH